MSKVVICSMVRDGMGYIERYLAQVEALAEQVPLRLILAEGDSTDGTWEWLSEAHCLHEFHFFKANHGGPRFGSVENAQRWWQISQVANRALDCVKAEDRAVVWVEADLVWEPGTIEALIDHLWDVDAVAPMSFAGDERRFYDIWGYRKDGRRFGLWPPYHRGVLDADGLVEIDSAGSCIAMRTGVALGCRYPTGRDGNDGIVGFCRDVRARGYRLWLDTALEVRHL